MPASVIGSLRVNLGLDSAQFARGARGLDAPLRRMRRQFLAVAGIATAMGTALAAAAIAGARQIDEAAKSARRLDASIGGFRALELAADEAGVSLSGLTNDIQTMNREIASIGISGNGQRALDALGISVAQLEGLDADAKLALIADQVQALGLDAGETTAILRDLGVRNREMALLVLQGGDAIRQARADIEEYGLALDDVDAARIEAANDSMGRLGLITQYAGQQIALALVPAMGRMADAMTNGLRAGETLRAVMDGLIGSLGRIASYVAAAVAGFGVRYVVALIAARIATFSLSGALVVLRGALIRTGIGVLVVAAGEAIYQFSRLVTATGGVGAALELMGNVANEVLTERLPMAARAGVLRMRAWWLGMKGDFIRAVIDMQATLFGFLGDASRATQSIPMVGPALSGGFAQAAQAMSESGDQMIATIDRLSSSSDALLSQSDALRDMATAPLESLQILRDGVAEISQEGETAEEIAARMAAALDNLEGAASGAAGAAGSLAENLNEATTFGEGFAEALEKGARTAVDMGRELGGALLRGIGSVSDAFAEFVVRGFKDFKGFAQSVLDTFKQLLVQMISMAVRNRIMIGLGISGGGVAGAGQAIAGGAGGGGGLLGGLFGGGGGGFLGSFGSTGGILGMGGLGGGTGLLGGLGNAISGGLGNIFNIGANVAAAGGGFAATLGAAIPVIGIAAAAFALFRTRTKQVDNGIRATVDEMGTLVEQFKIIKKVRAFGGRSYRTYYSDADDETRDFVTSTIDRLRDGVTAAADVLGFGADTFAGFAKEMRVSFYGMDDDEAQAALADALGGVSDAMADMIPGLADWRRETETSTDTLNRLAGGLVAANDAFDLLGFRLYDISLAGGDAASAFVELFGTIEDFQTATGSYYQNFYTEAERAAKATERLTAQLLALGVDGLPASRAAYRALVDEAKAFGDDDLTASLMKLAPAFASITGQANALADMFGQNALFRTRADQIYAATSGGYTKSIAQVQQEQGAEMTDLLREVVRAIREGDINNARINTKILAIQERLDLEPTA